MTPRLVLLHGFVGGAWSYAAVVAALDPRRDVLAPTLSYHAPTASLPWPDMDFTGEIERLAGEVVRSGSKPVDLVGYSMGGRLALGLALRHPELVRSLVLLSSRRGIDCPLERERRQQADEIWAEMLEQDGLEAFLERWWSQPIFQFLSRLPPKDLETELANRRTHRPAGLAAALRRWGLGRQPGYASEVRALQIPVTVVAGGLDEKFVSLSQQLATELPKGRSVVVEGKGHHLLLEAPARVARIIDEGSER